MPSILSWGFDTAGRMTSGYAYDPIGNIDLQNVSYQWGAVGNLSARSEQSGNKNLSESFAYDNLNRLTSATVAGRVANTVSYDSLGSIDVITDASGAIVQEQSFDAWGQRRNAVDWQVLSASLLAGFDHVSTTTRGFTSHEMLDEVGIIHMNGRIYDPKLGRFLQADPFVQSPTNSQSLNRYSYVLNNPLNATDPSGYFLVNWVIGKIAKEFDVPELVSVANIVSCAVNPLGCPAAVAASTYGYTGDVGAALKAGAFAAVSQAAFSWIGGNFTEAGGFFAENGLGHIAAHAVTGGVMSKLQGGKFGHGFISAGITKGLSPKFAGISGIEIDGIDIGEVMVAAALGGTISEMTGGKFANGAVTAAFANVFNAQQERRAQKAQEKLSDEEVHVVFKNIMHKKHDRNILKDALNLEVNDNVRTIAEAALIRSVGADESLDIAGALLTRGGGREGATKILRRVFREAMDVDTRQEVINEHFDDIGDVARTGVRSFINIPLREEINRQKYGI